jgi:hypothetical protein
MKKTIFVFIVIMTLVASLIGQTSVEKKKEVKDVFDLLSPEKKDKLIQMFVTDYPFKDSKEYKNYPETLNNYFSEPIYSKLRGNFMRGYNYNEGFEFHGNEIVLGNLKSVTEGKPFLKKFVEHLNNVFVGNGIKFVDPGKSAYEIGFCIVSVTPVLTEMSFPGVFIEVLMHNKKTGKSYFYRFGQGSKAGLNKAMNDSCCMVLATLFTMCPERTPAEN